MTKWHNFINRRHTGEISKTTNLQHTGLILQTTHLWVKISVNTVVFRILQP